MTDKERLEDIRAEVEQMAYTSPLNFEKTRINKESALWLIEQVERVEKLEEENDELAERVHKLALDWSELVDERNRYKQALEFYADEENYKENLISKAEQIDGNWVEPAHYEPPIIYFDKGQIARQALEGEE